MALQTKDLIKYCRSCGIYVITYKNAAAKLAKKLPEERQPDFELIKSHVNGYSLHGLRNDPDADAILYDGDMPEEAKCLTIAREIGHHMLGHLKHRDSELDDKQKDAEANIFACVLSALSVYSDIAGNERLNAHAVQSKR